MPLSGAEHDERSVVSADPWGLRGAAFLPELGARGFVRGPLLRAASPLEHWALNQFIVRKVQSRWTVTHDGIVLSWWSAAPAAIKAAVQVAANTARGGAAQVLMEDPSGCQTVLWDSATDAFTEV